MHGPARHVLISVLLVVLALGNVLVPSASVVCADCDHCRSFAQSIHSTAKQHKAFIGTISLQRYVYHPPTRAQSTERCINCQTASHAYLDDRYVSKLGFEEPAPCTVLMPTEQQPACIANRFPAGLYDRQDNLHEILRTVILIC